MATRESAGDLKTKIANLQQTRRFSAASMHRWLDILIADAEADLRRLTTPDGDGHGGAPAIASAPPPPPPPQRPAVAQAAAPALMSNPRSTYPFDEHAPFQRARRAG